MMVTTRRTLVFFISTLLILCLCCLITWVTFLRTSIVTVDEGIKYTVPDNTSMRIVVNDLYILNIIKHPWLFNLLIKMKGAEHQLKSGEYLFPKGTTTTSLLTQITTGTGLAYHIFTIIPGWDFVQLRHALDHDENIKHTITTLNDAAVMQQLGHADVKPEGQFYPDSYFFIKGSTDIALLKRAYNLMQTKLTSAWKKRDTSVPFRSAYEALTAASLVEKEAKVEQDRPLIAGVIVNRIHKNMLLQIDPTVIYGMGTRYHGVIHHKDLLAHNPYNTYVVKGLPPTPIAIPSMDSLNAAMHPKHHNYLYFVARENGDGSHQFSATLAEHDIAVKEARAGKFPATFFNAALVRFYFLNLVMPHILH